MNCFNFTHVCDNWPWHQFNNQVILISVGYLKLVCQNLCLVKDNESFYLIMVLYWITQNEGAIAGRTDTVFDRSDWNEPKLCLLCPFRVRSMTKSALSLNSVCFVAQTCLVYRIPRNGPCPKRVRRSLGTLGGSTDRLVSLNRKNPSTTILIRTISIPYNDLSSNIPKRMHVYCSVS